jgi:hypothetical protein
MILMAHIAACNSKECLSGKPPSGGFFFFKISADK